MGNDLFSDSSPDHVPLTLVRWLSPYPRAVLCDLELRPVCALPFDVNHATRRLSQTHYQRIAFEGRNISQQIDMFDGNDVRQQREQTYTCTRVRVQNIVCVYKPMSSAYTHIATYLVKILSCLSMYKNARIQTPYT